MDWLATNHQVLGDKSSTNLRKGYRVGDLSKNRDPDNSNTPLLHDQTVLEKEIKCGKGSSQTRSPNKSNMENQSEDKLINDEWTEMALSPRRSANAKTPSKSKRGGPGRSPLLSREWKGQESERLLIDYRDEQGAMGESDDDVWDPGWDDLEQETPTKGYRRINTKRN
ncbi:uncharacterized protein [Centruroides vittatus]|uniref:uncharacterized protein n=1 Tax=Centruroides vittatus TaxID=120091 RepID=UPI00350ED92F